MITDKFHAGDDVRINGSGDLMICREDGQYIGKRGIVVKITKKGLVYVYFPFNLKHHSFAARNVDLINYMHPPREVFDPTLWTIEATQDIQAQHGIDLEREMLERLMKEIGV